MLGIEDPQIWSAYLLSILSAVACVIYGVINWDKGDEPMNQQDEKWAKEEKEIESNL